MSQASSLPILDFSRFRAGGGQRDDFLNSLRDAAREVGFFYLSGHGIAAETVDELRALSRRFFALPEAEKRAIEMVNSPHFRGYTQPGFERTRGERDWREQVDFATEREPLRRDAGLPDWSRLQGPNQWPASLPDLKPAILSWQAQLTALAIDLLKAFALALDQDEDVFAPIYRDAPIEHIKIIRYPGRENTESEQGVGAHKDGGFLTILLQDETQGGLQVQDDDGSWIDAPAIPGTFIINIGEVLEMASNGYLRATVHRVVTPPAGRDRLSIAYFFGAQLDAVIPLLQLRPELAAEALGPAADPLNPLFRDIGRNYLKGRLRSHPDVARRHYADLLDAIPVPETASAY